MDQKDRPFVGEWYEMRVGGWVGGRSVRVVLERPRSTTDSLEKSLESNGENFLSRTRVMIRRFDREPGQWGWANPQVSCWEKVFKLEILNSQI